jgi:hypothetical protein
MGLALVLACLIGVLGALASTCLGLAFPGRTKDYTCASGLGEADGDRLLWGSGAVLALADLVDFFANEFTCLSRGRFARALVLTRFLNCRLVRHRYSPIRLNLNF